MILARQETELQKGRLCKLQTNCCVGCWTGTLNAQLPFCKLNPVISMPNPDPGKRTQNPKNIQEPKSYATDYYYVQY